MMSYDAASLIAMFCSAFLGESSFEEGKVVFQTSMAEAYA
jgi:hypothetical protein